MHYRTLLSRCCLMLVLLWYVLWVGTSIAKAAEPTTDVEAIRAAARQHVAAQLPAGVDVDPAQLDARMRMPACDRPLDTRTQSVGGGNARTVEVSCASPQRWKLYVPVRISDLQPRVVLTRSLRQGETISADDVRIEMRDAARAGGGASDISQVVGMVVRRPMAAGQIVGDDGLGNAPTVQRGQMVTLISSAGGFEVRASGKALGAAAPGEIVSVENLASGRVVQGTVNAEGAVLIRL